MPTFPPSDFVYWFRTVSPYIYAHRNNTFVIYFSSEVILGHHFPSLIQDIAVLNGLGIRLVLVYGIRTHIDRRLAVRGNVPHYSHGIRITDDIALECTKEAAGTVRVDIEALLSMGLAHLPMASTRIRVVSGNFVIAQPVGIRDGVDFQHTGEVRRIDVEALQSILHANYIPLLSAIGYSPTGEYFNLRSEEVAAATAIALQADKLLLLGEEEGIFLSERQWIRQLTTTEAEVLLTRETMFSSEVRSHLKMAVRACREGVKRVHLLNRHLDGAVLLELFTRDGVGTLISEAPFDTLRPGQVQDIPGLLALILPLEQSGVLVPRSKERLETDIEKYTVIERDGFIIGCVALYPFLHDKMGELACLALHPEYRGDKRGEQLLIHVEQRACALGLQRLFVLSTQTVNWFRERGFVLAAVGDLPEEKRAVYNRQRKSKILIKNIGSVTH